LDRASGSLPIFEEAPIDGDGSGGEDSAGAAVEEVVMNDDAAHGVERHSAEEGPEVFLRVPRAAGGGDFGDEEVGAGFQRGADRLLLDDGGERDFGFVVGGCEFGDEAVIEGEGGFALVAKGLEVGGAVGFFAFLCCVGFGEASLVRPSACALATSTFC